MFLEYQSHVLLVQGPYGSAQRESIAMFTGEARPVHTTTMQAVQCWNTLQGCQLGSYRML